MSKLIKCKTCGNEIAKSAKVCPHCGGENKRVNRGCIFVIILFVVSVIISGLVGEKSNVKSDSSNKTQPQKKSAKEIIEKRLDYLKTVPEISGFVVLDRNNIYITLKGNKLPDDYNLLCNFAAANASQELVSQKNDDDSCTVYLLPYGAKPDGQKNVIYSAHASRGRVEDSGDQPYGIKMKMQSMTPEQQKKYKNDKNQQRLANQFANKFERKFDGSIKPVVAYIKQNMKNPDSFKHVRTKWYIRTGAEGQYIVRMQYRGTNSFGAVVTENVEVIVDQNGSIIK